MARWESGGGQSDELNKPSDFQLSLTYPCHMRLTCETVLYPRCRDGPLSTDKEPQWVEGGGRQSGGRRVSDPVYHHAEVYGNKAARAKAPGTCWQLHSAVTQAGAREANGYGTYWR